MLESLSRRLYQEGARNVHRSGERVVFDGVTGYRSVAPLTNIERGEIEIKEKSGQLSYVIEIEKWPFVVFGVFSIVTTLAVLLGFNRLLPFAVFGAIILIFLCIHSFFIRRRFQHWLDSVLLSWDAQERTNGAS
jgi:hypothetical protein